MVSVLGNVVDGREDKSVEVPDISTYIWDFWQQTPQSSP
jgi:hypothetical protein